MPSRVQGLGSNGMRGQPGEWTGWAGWEKLAEKAGAVLEGSACSKKG